MAPLAMIPLIESSGRCWTGSEPSKFTESLPHMSINLVQFLKERMCLVSLPILTTKACSTGWYGERWWTLIATQRISQSCLDLRRSQAPLRSQKQLARTRPILRNRLPSIHRDRKKSQSPGRVPDTEVENLNPTSSSNSISMIPWAMRPSSPSASIRRSSTLPPLRTSRKQHCKH